MKVSLLELKNNKVLAISDLDFLIETRFEYFTAKLFDSSKIIVNQAHKKNIVKINEIFLIDHQQYVFLNAEDDISLIFNPPDAKNKLLYLIQSDLPLFLRKFFINIKSLRCNGRIFFVFKRIKYFVFIFSFFLLISSKFICQESLLESEDIKNKREIYQYAQEVFSQAKPGENASNGVAKLPVTKNEAENALHAMSTPLRKRGALIQTHQLKWKEDKEVQYFLKKSYTK